VCAVLGFPNAVRLVRRCGSAPLTRRAWLSGPSLDGPPRGTSARGARELREQAHLPPPKYLQIAPADASALACPRALH
jgi:hypothetical protein